MKTPKVKWSKHPILGDLELEFTNKETGEPYNNIVFAGEKGTGKRLYLNLLVPFSI